MYHLKFFISVFSWTVQQMWCVYSCVVMSFSSFSFYSSLSSLWFPLMQSQMRILGGGWLEVCVCVCVWVKPHPASGWWMMTPYSQHCVCVCVVAPAPRHLSLGLNPTLNRTSSVFHCGAFPHASFSMYDSLSNQREGDASVSDLIEPGCPRSAFQMLPLLKKQNS